jgi:hypothetical protein
VVLLREVPVLVVARRAQEDNVPAVRRVPVALHARADRVPAVQRVPGARVVKAVPGVRLVKVALEPVLRSTAIVRRVLARVGRVVTVMRLAVAARAAMIPRRVASAASASLTVSAASASHTVSGASASHTVSGASASLTVSAASASLTVSAASASHTVSAASASLTVSEGVVRRVLVRVGRVAMVMRLVVAVHAAMIALVVTIDRVAKKLSSVH